jgi:hypothetical protein
LAVESPLLTRDARGRLYVFGSGIEGVAVYDSTGRYLRSIGRKGSGPGEYQGASGVVALRGDSLALVDASLARISILAPNYLLARTTPVSHAGARPIVSSRDPRLLLLNHPDRRRGNSTSVVDIVTGKTVREFGDATGTPFASLPEGTVRITARDTTDGVWVSYATRYRIERWTFDGRRTAILERRAEWFPDVRSPRARETGEPQPAIISMIVDDSDRLWVLSTVADPDWKGAVKLIPGRPTPQVTNPLKYQDSILEVIDVRTGTVTAARRFDSPRITLLSGMYLGESGEDDIGRPVVRLSRLTLAAPR